MVSCVQANDHSGSIKGGKSSVDEGLLASQEGLCSMKIVIFTVFSEECKLGSSSLVIFSYSFLCLQFSDTFNLCSSPRAIKQAGNTRTCIKQGSSF
jgi:hypothetical protein